MLHVLFTRSKVIAGAEIDGEIQLLHFHNQTYLEQPGQSPFKNLDAYLADFVGAYHGVIGEKRDQAIPLAYATPVDVSSAERAQLRVKLSKLAQPASFELIHEDNLAVCYLLGVLSEQDMDLNGAAILDAQEQHTNVCLFKPGEDLQGEALMKANDPFKGENFEVYPLKDFGPSAGKERVLSELLRAFADAGKACDTPVLAQGVELIAASRQQFVRICLVSDIPDDFVAIEVQGLVKPKC